MGPMGFLGFDGSDGDEGPMGPPLPAPNIPLGRYDYYADMLDPPTTADWSINSVAPTSANPGNTAIPVRRFDDTIQEGAGGFVRVPVGAINLTLTIVGRAITAPPATTVAAGSTGVNINTFAGAGTLNVASTTGFPTSGAIQVLTSTGYQTVTYTGVGATTFTGCSTPNGAGGTLTTGNAVNLGVGAQLRKRTISANTTPTGAAIPAWNASTQATTSVTMTGTYTLTVASTRGFPASGTIFVTNTAGAVQTVAYTGTTGTTFTGCTGGSGSTSNGSYISTVSNNAPLLNTFPIAANAFFQRFSQIIAFTTLGITPGDTVQFEFIRDATAPADALVGDWALLELLFEMA
jgi:hypothetical protein